MVLLTLATLIALPALAALPRLLAPPALVALEALLAELAIVEAQRLQQRGVLLDVRHQVLLHVEVPAYAVREHRLVLRLHVRLDVRVLVASTVGD